MASESTVIPRPELETFFRAAIARSAEGRPGLIWLFGETGQGKTRFLKRFLGDLSGEAVTSYAACSSPVGNQSTAILKPYQPFKDILEDLLLHHDNARRRHALIRNISLTVLACIPVVGDLAYGIKEIRRDLNEYKRGERDVDFTHFVEGYFDTLLSLAEELPVVVAIDDVQWADKPTLLALERFLTDGRYARARVVVVLSGRRDEIQASTDALALYTRFTQTGSAAEIAVEPFDDDEIAQYFRGAFPRAPRNDEFLFWLRQKTGGNPFFLQSYLQHLQIEGLVDGEGRVLGDFEAYRGLPAEIRVVSSWLMKSLGEEQLQLLLNASVLGSEFSLHELAHLMQRPSLELARALRSIRTLHGIVERIGYRMANGKESTVYRFSQHAVHTAMYNELTAEEREDLHRIMAQYLNEIRLAHPGEGDILGSLAAALRVHARLGNQPEIEYASILLKAGTTTTELDTEGVLERLRALAPSLGMETDDVEDAYRRAFAHAPAAVHREAAERGGDGGYDAPPEGRETVESLGAVALRILGLIQVGRVREGLDELEEQQRRHEARFRDTHPMFALLRAVALMQRGVDVDAARAAFQHVADDGRFPTFAAIARLGLSLLDSTPPEQTLNRLQDVASYDGPHAALLRQVILFVVRARFGTRPEFQSLFEEYAHRLAAVGRNADGMRDSYPKTAGVLDS